MHLPYPFELEHRFLLAQLLFKKSLSKFLIIQSALLKLYLCCNTRSARLRRHLALYYLCVQSCIVANCIVNLVNVLLIWRSWYGSFLVNNYVCSKVLNHWTPYKLFVTMVLETLMLNMFHMRSKSCMLCSFGNIFW